MTAVILSFPKALKPRDEAFNAACEAYEYFDGSIQMMEASFSTDSRGVIAGMHNIFGGFRPEIKNKFLSFMNKPSFASWLAIRDYLIDLSTTSWQLWLKYDRSAPQTCNTIAADGPFPKPDDFIRYYAQHKSERLDMLTKKRDEALAIMKTYE
jgi:hypothetical protein